MAEEASVSRGGGQKPSEPRLESKRVAREETKEALVGSFCSVRDGHRRSRILASPVMLLLACSCRFACVNHPKKEKNGPGLVSRVVQVASVATTVINPVRIGKGSKSVQVDSKVIVMVGGGLAVVGLFGVVKAVTRSVAWLIGAKRGSKSRPEQSRRVYDDEEEEDAISVNTLESQSELCSYCSLISGLLNV